MQSGSEMNRSGSLRTYLFLLVTKVSFVKCVLRKLGKIFWKKGCRNVFFLINPISLGTAARPFFLGNRRSKGDKDFPFCLRLSTQSQESSAGPRAATVIPEKYLRNCVECDKTKLVHFIHELYTSALCVCLFGDGKMVGCMRNHPIGQRSPHVPEKASSQSSRDHQLRPFDVFVQPCGRGNGEESHLRKVFNPRGKYARFILTRSRASLLSAETMETGASQLGLQFNKAPLGSRVTDKNDSWLQHIWVDSLPDAAAGCHKGIVTLATWWWSFVES